MKKAKIKKWLLSKIFTPDQLLLISEKFRDASFGIGETANERVLDSKVIYSLCKDKKHEEKYYS